MSLHPNKLTCVTPLLTFWTWAASIGNLWCIQWSGVLRKEFNECAGRLGKGLPVHKRTCYWTHTIVLLCATFTANVAADPGPRITLHPTVWAKGNHLQSLCIPSSHSTHIDWSNRSKYLCTIQRSRSLGLGLHHTSLDVGGKGNLYWR